MGKNNKPLKRASVSIPSIGAELEMEPEPNPKSEMVSLTSRVPKSDEEVGDGGAAQIITTPIHSQAPRRTLSPIAIFSMASLAVQFGIQPILIQSFVGPGVLPATLVSCQE